MSEKKTRDKCKYILHFKSNSIDIVRIEDDNCQDIMEYAHACFRGGCMLKASLMSNLVVLTNSSENIVDRDKLVMVMVNEALSIQENDILCCSNDSRINEDNDKSLIDDISFVPLTIDDIEEVFNNSVIPFHRISVINYFAKQLNIKKHRGVFK